MKTITTRAGATWQVFLSTSGRDRKVYSPDEVDDFFIIDGDLHYYLIPLAEARGMHAIHLSALVGFQVRQARRSDAVGSGPGSLSGDASMEADRLKKIVGDEFWR